jgi:hypothetical protein
MMHSMISCRAVMMSFCAPGGPERGFRKYVDRAEPERDQSRQQVRPARRSKERRDCEHDYCNTARDLVNGATPVRGRE